MAANLEFFLELILKTSLKIVDFNSTYTLWCIPNVFLYS